MKTIGLIGGMSWESTNTMHKVAPEIRRHISIPVLHIAGATADELKKGDISKVGLLGMKYTMTQDFYKDKLIEAGIEVITSEGADIETVNDVIYHELCLGGIRGESKKKFVEIIGKLKARGAQGVILGCTEIGLLIGQTDTDLPVFDTTLIHARKASLVAIEA